MGLFDDLIPQKMTAEPPTFVDRPAVQPSRRVWGDAEAEQAGLYETKQPQAQRATQVAAALSFDDLIPQEKRAPLRITVNPAAGSFDDRFNAALPGSKQGISQGGAAVEGLRSGFTANFGDEMAGASAAASTPSELKNPFDFPSEAVRGLAQLGYEYLTGGDEAAKRYASRRDQIRSDQIAAKEQFPGTYLAGQVGGALAIPLGGALNAATLPGRMARGAAVGAGFGAASGAGEGTDATSRAAGAASGAALGGVVGAAAPPLVEGVIQGTRLATTPIMNAMRGAISPDLEASRRVAQSIQRGMDADPQAAGRLTAQEFAASAQRGGPARIVDLGGEPSRALGRSAANTSTEGRISLNQAVNDRFEGQSERVTGWLNDTFNFPNAAAQQQALEQTARNVNRGAYQRAYRDGSNGLWSPELERLASSDAVTSAMQAAARNARDEAVVGGYGAMNPRVTFNNGVMEFQRGRNGMPLYPDLQYWDLVRRELSDAARRAGPGTSEARRLNNFATTMNAELDRLVPSYQQARQGAAAFFGAENALEAGQNFVRSNASIPEARQAIARMSNVERQLFQDGFVSRYIETLNATGDRRNVLNQIAQSPASREKINMVLGPQRSAELEAGLRVEQIMDSARTAIQGNSTTARQLAELGFAGGAAGLGGVGTYNMDPYQLTTAAIAGAMLAGKRGIDQRVARRVAEMLASNNPQVLQRGIRMVARNDRMMNALRSADTRIGQISGQQAPVPALQGAVSRAEDQPETPRPPGQ